MGFKEKLTLSLLKWMDNNNFDQESKIHLLKVTNGNPSLMYESLVTAGLNIDNWNCSLVFE